MEGYIGEIRIFAGNFAPRNWAFCQAQTIQVRAYTALFSILGTTYGGNGSTTFNLPDFAGRVPIGAGQSPGNSLYDLGDQGGSASVTLLTDNLASHSHPVKITLTGGSATVTLNGSSNIGTLPTPAGNLVAGDGSIAIFAPAATTPSVAMASNAIQFNNVVAPTITGLTTQSTGGTQPHNNMQPYLALPFIVCLTGLFPSRN